ncbi:MAG: DNA mismatch repair endonuclease MutL [Prevotellaceae bacterium]|nr:DNA mismatch repair endonuclease MutL [Prevotellaceae bacterium]
MADIIRLLPDSVANQIAAGEVVQRPSSVVKELLENSIDAGATRIELWLTDAGKNCIQVIDNGKGMSETDARLSFERHATSKIKDAHDLFNLHTMGFRGEALASIAAVAQVELLTRTERDEVGVSITMEGARCIDQHPIMCPVGANFSVRNLFFNVPARRRFLKSNITEMNNVMQEFERVALINPDVAFKLYKDDSIALDLKAGNFKQRILALFGQSFDKHLLPLSIDTDIVKADGFVGTVQSAKLKGYKQFFFVNGRYMKHPYFNKAVQAAFDRLLPPEKQVSFFLRLTVDAHQIDVNIHPNKTEIKFEDDRAIWQLLLVAVRDALGKHNAVPTIDFDNTLDVNIPTFGSANMQATEPRPFVNTHYNPFETDDIAPALHKHNFPHTSRSLDTKQPFALWQDLYGSPHLPSLAEHKETITPPDCEDCLNIDTAETNPTRDDAINDFISQERTLLQYSSRFIITPVKSGLMVIDSVRAHLRILYDKFMASLLSGESVSQSLLFPEFVQLGAAQSYIMNNLLPQLNTAGFDISPAGTATYAVSAVPAIAAGTDCTALLTKIVEDYDALSAEALNLEREYADSQTLPTLRPLFHALALTLARSNSMRAEGRQFEQREMATLVDDLFACQIPNFTPDGKAVISIIPAADIAKRFT